MNEICTNQRVEQDDDNDSILETYDFEINEEDVQIIKRIGSGNFSNVFVGKFNGQIVAVKRQVSGDKNFEDYIARELIALKSLKHPNLLHYYGACKCNFGNEIWIITEYLSRGDLSQIIKAGKLCGKCSWRQRIQIALDVAYGIRYLHEQKYLHRDVKPQNMLLTEDWTCKLCDFGFAREKPISSNNKKINRRLSLLGTDAYMAPEIYFDEEYDEKADIFSYGVSLVELITEKNVNEDDFCLRSPQKRFALDIEEIKEYIPASCPRSFSLLAESCVSFEPNDRPTSTEVVEWLEDLISDTKAEEMIQKTSEESKLEKELEEELAVPETNKVSKKDNEILCSTYDLVFQGWLYAKTKRPPKLWKKRWYVVNGSQMYYFTSLDGNEEKSIYHDVIKLKNCTLSKDLKKGFNLIEAPDMKIWKFSTNTEQERKTWFKYIEQSIWKSKRCF